MEYVKLWEEEQDEQSNTLDGSWGMKLFIIICVCVFFVSRFAVCLYQYIFLLKSFTFSKITTMQVLSVEEWLKAFAIYFYEKKMEYFMTWSFGVFGKWKDQSAQLRSNLLSYIKLKFFYVKFSQLCMYIWSFVQLAYLLKLIFWKIWILL